MQETEAQHIKTRNKNVKSHNDKMLKKIDSELVVIEAVQILPRGRKSIIDKSKGTIGQTDFLEFLEVRVGARVVLIFNVDIMDDLYNGACGTVIGIEKDRNGQVRYIVVKFDDESCGRSAREKAKRYNTLSEKYLEQNGTPISRFEHEFNLASRKGWTFATKAKLKQFPLRLAYAQTGHKMQVNFQSIQYA